MMADIHGGDPLVRMSMKSIAAIFSMTGGGLEKLSCLATV
jgi:hypothetical protein